ncbi:MAG: hypothetical protein LH474_05060 [Chamaesiphon sp.]|nr:hypothetical protein [Chamaesiphon sp.]
MAKPIEQVEQDLHQLRTTSRELGRELTAAYRSYFGCFAPTLKQQSIQGCYHLCTNFYPEAFLKINYDRRAQLLKTLQRVISNAIADLSVHIESSGSTSNSENDDEPTGELTAMPAIPIDWFETPSSLSTWQRNLEEELNHSLKEISYKLNVLLQQAQIMPSDIPKPILEANPEADRQGGNTANIPNLLSVLIGKNSNQRSAELDEDDDDEEEDAEDALDAMMENLIQARDPAQIIQIHSLYLRLTEVEFSNVTVLSLRKNISQLANKVKILNREYMHKQQELKIAEAEAAWRNSWFENP